MPSSAEPRLSLVVLTPVADRIDPAYFISLRKLEARCGFQIAHEMFRGGSHVGVARERVLWDAIRKHDPTHLLFIDADMGWEPDVIYRLLDATNEYNLEFAAVAGVRKSDEPILCFDFFPGKQEFHPRCGFLKVRAVGMAMALLKRSVIDRLVAAHPELAYRYVEDTEHALFLDMIDGDLRLTEDYAFCRRWTRLGGEIWLDPMSKLSHVGSKEYVGPSLDELFAGSRSVSIEKA